MLTTCSALTNTYVHWKQSHLSRRARANSELKFCEYLKQNTVGLLRFAYMKLFKLLMPNFYVCDRDEDKLRSETLEKI
jgi:hypothetical protein